MLLKSRSFRLNSCLGQLQQPDETALSTSGCSAQVTLTSGPNAGTDYNVGTEVDSFVYNTVAAWYNEDGENGTLPMAPPGPPPQKAGSSTLLLFSVLIFALNSACTEGCLRMLAEHAWHTFSPNRA